MAQFLTVSHVTTIVTKIKTWVLGKLPAAATASAIGLVKPGTGLSVDAAGTLSVNSVGTAALPVATKSAKGAVIVGDGLTVDAAGKVAFDVTKLAGLQNETQVKALAKSAADTAKSELIGGAPETYDTLKEIADYIAEHGDVVTSLNAAIGNKADKTALETLQSTVGEITAATDAEVGAAVDAALTAA